MSIYPEALIRDIFPVRKIVLERQGQGIGTALGTKIIGMNSWVMNILQNRIISQRKSAFLCVISLDS
jgi:hypothetical protein